MAEADLSRPCGNPQVSRGRAHRSCEGRRRGPSERVDVGLVCIDVGCDVGLQGAGTSRRSRPATAVTEPPLRPQLTVREIECIRWAALGMTTLETARELGVAERTVEFHLTNAMRKLGAANKVRAVVIAVQRNLISP